MKRASTPIPTFWIALLGALLSGLTPASSPRLGVWGLESEHISQTIHPGDDFFLFVNQGWVDQAEMPAGFSRFGAFGELALEAENNVETIIGEALEHGQDSAPGSPMQQIGTLYASYMDTARIEELGLKPIRHGLDALLALESHEEVARWMARAGTNSIIRFGIGQDAGDPTRYITSIGQGGLGLPNRDYYSRDDAPFPEHREAYVAYIAATFERAGIDGGAERAEAIMALETRLADIHWSRVQQRDRQANYDLKTRAELDEFAPDFPWSAFFRERGLDGISELVVNNNSAVQASAALFVETPVDTWASYHAFHWINNHATQLPKAFADAHFELFQRSLRGVEEQRPRDRGAINSVSRRLGELVGQIYVQRHFPPAHREQMLELVEYLRRAFRERLETLAWMDEETRVEAHAKLETFLPKIGYPDRWRDYSDVRIEADDLVGNFRRLGEWLWTDSLARLDEPVRQWEWVMSPQTVNAYYSSTRNEIVFPAAILQPPFFDPYADAAVNFGAIGGVIGHEMGHGFDDQGSRSDSRGVLRNWWTERSREQFEQRTSRLVKQYDGFAPLPGMHVNGRLSLGENIGDLGGLSIAHHAYRLYLADHHDGQAPVPDGLSGDQRFFMAWAQVWRTIETEQSLRARLIQGPHSPATFRVNGVVRNIDAWYEAFEVGPDHELYIPADQRVNIW
jgi:endothelin-converting enzyme/putative endopeptidase